LILAAGGSSRRFGGGQNKLLVHVDGLPLFCHTLQRFLARIPPDNVVIVVPEAEQHRFRAELADTDLEPGAVFVAGGDSRQLSVWNGLRQLPDNVNIVAVQDAARPQTPLELLDKCVASARTRGSGVTARPMTDTVKQAGDDGRVQATLDRSTLWAAETPQVFRRQLLERAYRELWQTGQSVTDDAHAVEQLGEIVYLIPNREPNPKITFPGDLRLL